MKRRVSSGQGVQLLQGSAQSRKWFIKMFYALAAVPVALAVELCVRQSSVASAVTGIIVLSIMVSAVFYSWAMFKSFHYRIFYGEEREENCAYFSWKFLLSRMGEAVLWLLALIVVIAAILFLHAGILGRMPKEVLEAEAVQTGIRFISENLGTGIFLAFSIISLLFQAIVLISITYTAAAASHLRYFERYKTLAGIFVFVLLYFFENDFSGALKKIMISGIGGIEKVMSQDVNGAIVAITGVELAACLIVTAINLLMTRYFLKKTEKGGEKWKK